MNSIADGSVIIQTSSESVPATPSWFGEAALIVERRELKDSLRKILAFFADQPPSPA